MTEKRVWELLRSPDPKAAGGKGEGPKVQFKWQGRPPEEFNLSQLRATIQILRNQGRPTVEYEEALAGLLQLESGK
jgi:hypothetical protein